MKLFIQTNKEEVFYKNILFDDNRILASDRDYKDEATLRTKVLNKDKGRLDTHLNVAYLDIKKIKLFEDKNIIQIFFNHKKASFDLQNQSKYKEILQLLLNKNTYKESTENQNNIGSYVKPALYTLIAGLFSCSIVFIAHAIENGERLSASGSNKGMKQLFITIAEKLGITGSLIFGCAITFGFAYYTIMKFKSSKKQSTVYKI